MNASRKAQFNIQLPPRLASKVRADARRNNKTLDAVAEIIFCDFFAAWTLQERSKFYQHAQPKKTGRRIRGKMGVKP